MGSVFKHSQAAGSAFAVLLAIADTAGDDGVALPKWDTSIRTLALKARVSERTCQYAIKELERLGELTRLMHNGKHSNTYQIHLDRNRNLFEGPPTVQIPVDKSYGGAQNTAERGAENNTPGCKIEQEGVQQVAPNPSIPYNKEKIPAPAKPARTSLPPDFLPSPETMAWAEKAGFGPYVTLHLAYFLDYGRSNPARVRYTDWQAAFRNCIRSDWGKVRAQLKGAAPKGGQPDNRWWHNTALLEAKAKELHVLHMEGEPGFRFHARVLAAAGPGPWDPDPGSEHGRLVAGYREKSGVPRETAVAGQ